MNGVDERFGQVAREPACACSSSSIGSLLSSRTLPTYSRYFSIALSRSRALKRKHCLFDDVLVHCYVLEGPSFISMRLKVYLMGVVRVLSWVSRTKTASSFAGSVLLALRLIEWIAPGGSDQLAPAR